MYQADTRRRILSYERQYRTSADRMAELRLQEDLHILKDAQVVGMTTTGRKVGALPVEAEFTVVSRSRQMKKTAERGEATLTWELLVTVSYLLLQSLKLKTITKKHKAQDHTVPTLSLSAHPLA